MPNVTQRVNDRIEIQNLVWLIPKLSAPGHYARCTFLGKLLLSLLLIQKKELNPDGLYTPFHT